ncbi:MAG: ATP-binding protein, partial [Proteobacteria bacterium]|nr:ATP-binding protein [Pseudomonadota bacterium]
INYVVAIDMMVDEIFKQISQLKTTDNGRAFLFNEDHQVFAPRGEGTEKPEIFIPADEFGDGLVADAVKALKKIGKNHTPETVSFSSNGRKCWIGSRRLNNNNDWNVWIGVAVPESDFVKHVSTARNTALWVSLLILGFGVLIAVFIFRGYAKQFKDRTVHFFDADGYEPHLLALIAGGEGDRLEFKSTVRMNLKSGKYGKEIEQAWLKTVAAFLNSSGGFLIIGVSDSGDVLGLDSDGFESEDRCKLHIKNVLNHHIGAEFTSYIRFDVKRVQGKGIVVISCEPAKNPVFLIYKKEESFFIRSGPSSVQLPLSKALEYINQRKKTKSERSE